MSYVDNNLSDGETVEYRARVSKWTVVPHCTLAALLAIVGLSAMTDQGGLSMATGMLFLNIAFVAAGLYVALPALITLMTSEMAVTNIKVIAKRGVISRDTIEMGLSKVESIQVHQGILGRLFDYGTIIVSGAGNPQAPIRGIAQPMKFRAAVLQAQQL